MQQRVVVIGASSGGLDAVRFILESLPADFSAPICVVIHIYAQSPPDVLAAVLQRATELRVVVPKNGEPLKKRTVYVAPPDQHFLVDEGTARLTRGPKENRFRPAIDPLFRSAALGYGARAIGVVLTGNLDDGTSGLVSIKQAGGIAIVQDPADARYPSMPQSAVRHVAVDHCVPLAAIPTLLSSTIAAPAPEALRPNPPELTSEVNIAKEKDPVAEGIIQLADPSPFACPECHGVLLRMKSIDPVRFRCHTGHAYSAESLLAALSESIEATLWSGIRALQESELFLAELSDRMRPRDPAASKRLTSHAASAHRDAVVLKDIVESREPLSDRD